MKLITSAGVIRSARRFISGANNVSESEMSDSRKVAEVIRKMSVRVAELEARVAKEGTEFEVIVGVGGALTAIQHNMRCPVRYFVVSWCRVDGQASPILAPVLVRDDTSTSTTLVLRSYVSGRAIVRVEPAFADIDPGVSVGDVVPTPAKAIAYSSLSSNVTINVAAYATLLTASITTATTGGGINISFSAAATNTVACSVFFQVLVDGVVQKGVRVDIAAGGGGDASAVLRVTGVSPGSHTVLLQWKTNVNGASIHAATVVEEHASLLVEETV